MKNAILIGVVVLLVLGITAAIIKYIQTKPDTTGGSTDTKTPEEQVNGTTLLATFIGWFSDTPPPPAPADTQTTITGNA